MAEKPVVNVDTLTQCGQGTVALRFDMFYTYWTKDENLIRLSILKSIGKITNFQLHLVGGCK